MITKCTQIIANFKAKERETEKERVCVCERERVYGKGNAVNFTLRIIFECDFAIK